MNLSKAIQKCNEGHFLTHQNFDSKQSMHSYRGQLFYEDGASGDLEEFLETQDWAKEGWSIKFNKDEVCKDLLKEIHETSKYMLSSGMSKYKTYEECIKGDLI